MNFTDFLNQEWVLACGCTEPAAIAYAASLANEQLDEPVRRIQLTIDSRMYKNCYAVGIPHSNKKIGLLWAAAIGASLKESKEKLSIFEKITQDAMEHANALINGKCIKADVDASKESLYIDVTVFGKKNSARVVLKDKHTHVYLIEKNSEIVFKEDTSVSIPMLDVRYELTKHSFDQLLELASSISNDDRKSLQKGVDINLKISEHGLTLFPKKFIELSSNDTQSKISTLVCAGVYARMSGEDFPVMSIAGAGNKGIVCSIPLQLWGQKQGRAQDEIDEAIAFSCLITSVTTQYLGSLSAVCGCSNAAGIGLAAGLVKLGGGSSKELSLAIHNMVGNVTGMICDGAKIGCAMKTMTAVDAAFRAASLALSGIGIPVTDGIVAEDGIGSLKNLARIANQGMISADAEILAIMKEKQVS